MEIRQQMAKNRKSHIEGYTIIILAFAIFILSLALMVAVPVWQTQIQRDLEEELIFRGNQFVEAVRIFQSKNPGRYPENFEEMIEDKYLRKMYLDPMTEDGEWNVILLYQTTPAQQSRQRRRRPTRSSQQRQQQTRAAAAPQKVLIAPISVLPAIENPQILGVVSKSIKESKKIYNDQTSYDKWLFFFGQDPTKMPEIVYYGQENQER